MGVYEYECLSCKESFLICNLSRKETANLACAYCKSKSLNLIGFDESGDESSYILAKAIGNLQVELENLRERIEALES